MRVLLRLFLALWVSTIISPALAETTAAGNAVAVVQQAKGDLNGSTILISPGDDLFIGQKVITGNIGQVQVVFSDQTHLVIGPQSSLVISQYLMRNDGNASKVVIDALAGSFRFVTGNSPKKAYEINTPTGTMGVRGTAFDFDVDKLTKETWAVLYHGGLDMCAANGKCVALNDNCSVGVMPATDPAILRNGDKRKLRVLKSFRYLDSQRPLKRDFRIEGISACKGPHVDSPTPNQPEIVLAAVVVPVVEPPKEECPPPPPPKECPPPKHESEHKGDSGKGGYDKGGSGNDGKSGDKNLKGSGDSDGGRSHNHH